MFLARVNSLYFGICHNLILRYDTAIQGSHRLKHLTFVHLRGDVIKICLWYFKIIPALYSHKNRTASLKYVFSGRKNWQRIILVGANQLMKTPEVG